MRDYIERIAGDLANERATTPQYVEYDEPPVDVAELLRYTGFPADKARAIASGSGEDQDVLARVERAIELARGKFVFKAGYMTAPLSRDADGLPDLPFEQRSVALARNLRECVKVVFFAVTIGSAMDRLIRRYERSEVDLALFLQGYGAERAEALADALNSDIKKAAERAGYRARPRFSPGYGDLPLAVQKDFLTLLDASRRMGITLADSCLMAPSKSVTAIVGLERV